MIALFWSETKASLSILSLLGAVERLVHEYMLQQGNVFYFILTRLLVWNNRDIRMSFALEMGLIVSINFQMITCIKKTHYLGTVQQ